MTYYHKCKNCAVDKNACERRQEIKNAIKGLGLTSLKFGCAARKPLFCAGQRVEFDWSYWDESARDIYGECEEDILKFTGTVACELEHMARFIIRVDQVAVQSSIDDGTKYSPKDVFKNGGFAVKVRPAAMRAIEEPIRSICVYCLGYEVGERCVKDGYCNPSVKAMCAQVVAK